MRIFCKYPALAQSCERQVAVKSHIPHKLVVKMLPALETATQNVTSQIQRCENFQNTSLSTRSGKDFRLHRTTTSKLTNLDCHEEQISTLWQVFYRSTKKRSITIPYKARILRISTEVNASRTANSIAPCAIK
jgi:hypothetical protein